MLAAPGGGGDGVEVADDRHTQDQAGAGRRARGGDRPAVAAVPPGARDDVGHGFGRADREHLVPALAREAAPVQPTAQRHAADDRERARHGEGPEHPRAQVGDPGCEIGQRKGRGGGREPAHQPAVLGATVAQHGRVPRADEVDHEERRHGDQHARRACEHRVDDAGLEQDARHADEQHGRQVDGDHPSGVGRLPSRAGDAERRMTRSHAEPVEAESGGGRGVEQVPVAWILRHGRAAPLLITERAVPLWPVCVTEVASAPAIITRCSEHAVRLTL